MRVIDDHAAGGVLPRFLQRLQNIPKKAFTLIGLLFFGLGEASNFVSDRYHDLSAPGCRPCTAVLPQADPWLLIPIEVQHMHHPNG